MTCDGACGEAEAPRILVLSGADHIRFPTMINHKAYADRHGYRYRFDITPRADRTNPFFHKLAAIADAVVDTDWLFWLDDDAIFSQPDRRLEAVVPELADPELCAVFCASPVNPEGGWTYLSSGNFFLRNCPAGRRLIEAASRTSLDVVQAWWDPASLGMFTGGDQDALVYQIRTDPEFARRVLVLEFERFNTRPYHFETAGQHFLAHFTNQPGLTKLGQMTAFAARFGLTPDLVEEAVAARYDSYRLLQNRMLSDDA